MSRAMVVNYFWDLLWACWEPTADPPIPRGGFLSFLVMSVIILFCDLLYLQDVIRVSRVNKPSLFSDSGINARLFHFGWSAPDRTHPLRGSIPYMVLRAGSDQSAVPFVV